jgi:hypothetical protein
MQNTRSGRGAVDDNIVVKVPVACKGLVDSITRLTDAVAAQAESTQRGGEAIDYLAWEQEVAKLTAEVECAAHECTLSALEVDAPRVEIGGETYTHVGYGKGTYRGVAGPVEVPRALYRKLGERNAAVVDAISLRAGVIGDGWLPMAARAMAHKLQNGTSREAEQAAKETGRLPYSRASFERVPHEVGALYVEHRADIEDRLMQEMLVPAEACSVSVSLDRASLPMEEPIERPPGRPRKDAPKIKRVFHMAFCGTVTLHDAKGRALHTIRFGQMPALDPVSLCGAMANAVFRLREKQPALALSLLADGAHDMWGLLETHLPIEVFGWRHRLVDFYHVIEKLYPAAVAIFGADEAKGVIRRWKTHLKRRKNAAAEILAELEASGCEEIGDSYSERPVHSAITYLTNHSDRMNYAGARAKGLPIGSGNVEATCKTLVGIRMKRAGARWKEETGEHVLKLRALALSDLWDGAMTKLMATQSTSVRRLAA